MSSSRNLRSKSRYTRSSGESESNDNNVLEAELRNLLTNAGQQKRPRNIFNNIHEIPRLRRSVVARAVQNVVCSTPMPTEKNRDFFYAENSLNISPIDPISEEVVANVEIKETGKDNVENKINKQALVVLTKTSLTIVISDSEDEQDDIAYEVQSKHFSNNTESKINNTRSKLNKFVAKQEIENDVDIDKIHKSVTNRKLENNNDVNSEDLSKHHALKDRSNISNTLSIRNNKSVKQNKSIYGSHLNDVEVVQSLKNKSINRTTLDKPGAIQNKSATSNGNLELNNTVRTPCQISNILQTAVYDDNLKNNQNISTDIRNTNTVGKKEGSHSTKNKNNYDVQNLKKISPRKLSFTKDSGEYNGNTTVMRHDESKSEKRKDETKLSKIPLIRSRSKSKEKRTSKTLNNNLSEDREKHNESGNSNKNSYQHECPPKRPPRKNKLPKNKKKPIVTTSLVANQSELSNLQGKNRECEDTTNTTEVNNDVNVGKPSRFIKDISKIDSCLINLHNACKEQSKTIKALRAERKHLNPEKTLVEVGTSPLLLISTERTEAGTSPCSFVNEKEIITKDVRAENLNQIVKKITQKCMDSSGSRNTQKNNGDPIRKSWSTSKVKHMGVQTPIKRNICTQTSIEQQSQGVGSITSNTKSFKKVNELSNNTNSIETSSSLPSTEHSKLIRDFDNLLFQTLKQDDALNFSCNDNDVENSVLSNNSQQNRPWRADFGAQVLPRRSSVKLNFLRSAQAIETERSQICNNCNESINELYCRQNIDKTVNGSSQDNMTSSTKRNKLQVYSRITQQNMDKVSVNLRLQPTDINKPSNSSNNLISDISISESDSEYNSHTRKKQENSSVINKTSTEKLKNLENQNQINNRTLSVGSKKQIENNQDGGNLKSQLRNSPLITKEALNKPDLVAEHNDTMHENKSDETIHRIENKRISNATCGLSNFNNLAHEDDDEVLAIPLEDSDSPALEQISVNKATNSQRNSKIQDIHDINKALENSESDENTIDNPTKTPSRTKQSKRQKAKISLSTNSTVNKPIKSKVLKSKRKKDISESEGIVSSTTVEPEEETGPRRSGRERKATQRRCYGTIETHSEKMLNYYNAWSVPSDKSVKLKAKPKSQQKKTKQGRNNNEESNRKSQQSQIAKPNNERTLDVSNKIDKSSNPDSVNKSKAKPKSQQKKSKKINTTDEINKEPELNKSRQERKKKEENNRRSQQSQIESNERILDVSNKINEPANPDLGIVETDNIIDSNEINGGTEESISEINTSRKHVSNTEYSTSEYVIPKKKSKATETNNEEPKVTAKNGVSPNRRTNGKDLKGLEMGDSYNHVSDTDPIHHKHTNTDFEGLNHFSHIGSNEDFVFCNNLSQNNANSVGECTTFNKIMEKDSGRSTLSKITTFEDSNVKICKPLTGRIGKNYKKKSNVGKKISKVLSRSINTSKECEMFNDDEPIAANSSMVVNIMEDVSLRRTSIIQSKPVDSEYINLLSNNNLSTIRYVDKEPKFKVTGGNLMFAEGLRNAKDGGTSGYLKLPPGSEKPLHIARKFALFYFVIEGEGLIQVGNKTSKVVKLSTFIVPLGVEYSIHNINKEDALILGFVKTTPKGGL